MKSIIWLILPYNNSSLVTENFILFHSTVKLLKMVKIKLLLQRRRGWAWVVWTWYIWQSDGGACTLPLWRARSTGMPRRAPGLPVTEKTAAHKKLWLYLQIDKQKKTCNRKSKQWSTSALQCWHDIAIIYQWLLCVVSSPSWRRGWEHHLSHQHEHGHTPVPAQAPSPRQCTALPCHMLDDLRS